MGQVLARCVENGLPREVATALVGIVIGWYFSRASAPSAHRTRPVLNALKKRKRPTTGLAIPDTLDLRRQAQLVLGRPSDHGGEVIVQTRPGFDLNETIFSTLPTGPKGILPRTVVAHRLGVDLFWDDVAAVEIQHAFAQLHRPPQHDKCLLEFMYEKCNFNAEHADGSFLDHLQFCYEYSASYFKQHSPRVLFLHSILGVGTNVFPMAKEHEPTLAGMLTDVEMKHVAAFPSILRLLASFALVDELKAADTDRLQSIQRIEFHRVIDNEPMSLTGEEFWIQLNYQLIHLLDFLPVAHWAEHADDLFLQQFIPLHDIMTRCGKLTARVDFELTSIDSGTDGRPLSLAKFINQAVPASVKRKLATKSIKEFSSKIGHSLDYTITYK
eukprot:m.209453 g.209453  ORF g.209453 m.209453 type:complete len:385 (+) comp24605_c0_seq1:26-1180(+)